MLSGEMSSVNITDTPANVVLKGRNDLLPLFVIQRINRGNDNEWAGSLETNNVGLWDGCRKVLLILHFLEICLNYNQT